MGDIWFTGDTHYHHKNIVRGTTNWRGEQNLRDFDTLKAHDEALLSGINDNVKPGDTLYHLGDVAFGGKQALNEFVHAIQCQDMHLIYGNHDHHIRHGLTSHLWKSTREMKPLGKIGGIPMVLCHYAMSVWDQSHHGSWQLHGHSHGSLPPMHVDGHRTRDEYYSSPLCYQMDVGVDTHPEFRPYHIDEIRELFKDRAPLRIDHHSKETN